MLQSFLGSFLFRLALLGTGHHHLHSFDHNTSSARDESQYRVWQLKAMPHYWLSKHLMLMNERSFTSKQVENNIKIEPVLINALKKRIGKRKNLFFAHVSSCCWCGFWFYRLPPISARSCVVLLVSIKKENQIKYYYSNGLTYT